MKERILLILEQISADKDNSSKINEIEDRMFGMYKPNIFDGRESSEVKYDKNFESSCLVIAQKTSLNAKKMTVLQFYSSLDSIKQQNEAEAKMFKHNKIKRHG
jgi:hypothetical protein